ncbi:histidine protein methyltransferase 1 homolog [Formica exsecta]|uniref:histidine protein methyltransferase 1 homolog n=1 Tax=Formica exsecta TaxID=72781 RepID=UPI001142CE52|nr:histidine protein methyltransferase 1 homolog [Formica exsecta]XP_029669304.1 histidine protein methyltransferase 1 homolog [Formica exsecta]
MFKFGFAKSATDANEEDNDKKDELEWIPASKLEITSEQIGAKYETDYYTETKMFPDYNLKLIRCDKVVKDLTKYNCQNIIEAETQHSDLIPAKYEGGLKIWECTFDLGQYILEEQIELKDKLVMDLGCGAGLIGLIALLKSSTVHFQDYNAEVLRSVTIPNILLNFNDRANILTKCEFYAGDWASLTTLFDDDENRKYDYIFTSETIYNPDNHKKLYEIFKRRLKINGFGFIAGKTYYFGVGGGMRQFENLVSKDGCFDVKSVWRSQDGVNREILKLTRKPH